MKKLLIAACMVVAIGSSAFAADVKGVNYKTKYNFEAQFSGAQNVVWTVDANYAKVAFTLNNEKIEAFYSVDGDQIGYTRKIDIAKLPGKALQRITKNFASYNITEAIEFNQDDNRNYYVSLENGNAKKIVQVTATGDISNFK